VTVFYPEATPSLGTTKVKILTTVGATPEALSLATHVNAVGSYDASLTFRDWAPSVNPNSGSAPRRLATKTQMPQEGLSQYAPIAVAYPYDPQAPTSDPNNEAMEVLVEGSIVYALVRKGPDAEDEPFAAAQHYELWKCRAGRQNRGRSGDDEFAEHEIQQMLYPMQPEVYGIIAA
jgi:hypothetical protein